jgi:uncharacterized peroxidase-related enzyme
MKADALRIDPKRRLSEYPWYVRPFFWNQHRKYGAVLDSALLWARSPRLFLGAALLYGIIDRKSSPIEPALRSLLTVRVSQINGCRFCVDLNSATLLKRGARPEKVDALDRWRESSVFNDRERAALDYAEAMTRSDLQVDDGVFARLRRHFDDEAIIELTALVAFQNMSSKFNSALGVPPQGFCRAQIRTRARLHREEILFPIKHGRSDYQLARSSGFGTRLPWAVVLAARSP